MLGYLIPTYLQFHKVAAFVYFDSISTISGLGMEINGLWKLVANREVHAHEY